MEPVRWKGIDSEQKLLEELRQLPEGTPIPNFENGKTHIFLRIDEKERDGRLVLLTEAGRGNIYNEPCIEEYSLRDVLSYRENGIDSGEEIELITLKGPGRYAKPKKRTDPTLDPNFSRYCKMLNTHLNRRML